MTTDEAGGLARWWRAVLVYCQPRMLAMLFLGFSSGLPFYLIYQTLTAWLRQEGIARSAIGMLAWVGLIYTLKFVWSPAVDRVPLPLLTRWLGRRRAWLLVAQVGIVAGLLNLSTSQPAQGVLHVALGALFLAFCAATQDIALDAWRIESAPDEQQGAMAAAYQLGYRAALIAGSAGALGIAAFSGWHAAYLTMAALGGVGILTTLLVREPEPRAGHQSLQHEDRVTQWLARNAHLPQWLRNAGAAFISAVVCPLTDFFGRFRFSTALLLLLFMGCYRMAEFTVGPMANPFYIDHGYTLGQIATVVKTVGLVVSLFGVVLAGAVIARLGIVRAMVMGGLLMVVANLGFMTLAFTRAPTLLGLGVVNSLDNLTYALAGTALIAFLSSLTSTRYTATQYALFSSFYAIPGKLLEGLSGFVVDRLGYPGFFMYTASLALPALVLLWVLTRPGRRAALPGVNP